MSLTIKLKRAFHKAHKLFIFLIVFLLAFSFFSLSVSAAKENSDINIIVSKVQIKYLDNNGAELTPFQNCYPVDMLSPFGGTFQGCKRDDNDYIAEAMQWNMNIYFNQIVFEKGKEYTIKGYFALPWSKLITDDYWNIYKLDISLCDSDRNVRYRVDTSKATQESAWKKGLVTNVNTAEFGFLPFEFTFVPGNTFKGWFFNCFLVYNLLFPPNGGGYFGFSDLLVSYESDPLTDKNYSKVDGSSINNHNQLEDSILSDTAVGRNDAVDMIGGINDLADSNLFKGLLAWSKIITYNLNNSLWFSDFLKFSLAIGLFAFLLGLGIYVANVHSSKVRRENAKSNKRGRGG